MEDLLDDVEPVLRFVGLRLLQDEPTIFNFRHLLERHGLVEVLLMEMNRQPGIVAGQVNDQIGTVSYCVCRRGGGRVHPFVSVDPCRWSTPITPGQCRVLPTDERRMAFSAADAHR